MSASSSRVAETLRFRPATSSIVSSAWRLIAFRFSCCSFCSRGVIAFLSGFENEGVIFQQRDRGGGEFVEQRIAQPERRLRAARASLLAQDVGNIVGAESTGRGGFFDSAGHILGAVLPDQFQQFGDLTTQRTVGIGHVAEISFDKRPRTQTVE